MPTPFDQAVLAIIDGDEPVLRRLLAAEPDLVRQRSDSPHRATLLHYVGANGVEMELQKSPRNAAAGPRAIAASTMLHPAPHSCASHFWTALGPLVETSTTIEFGAR